jgi:uncharacterized protein
MFENLWFIPLGFVAGLLGSIIGLGGGIIIVPVLTFLGFPPTVAASNSLFVVFGNAASSSLSYAKQKRIEYSIGIKLGLLSIPGSVLGALISAEITPVLFKILFGFILILASIYIFSKRKIEFKGYTQSKQVLIFALGASFFAGIISGLFGVGGGIIFVPVMVILMGMLMKNAAPTSQFILLFAASSGLMVHILLGHPEYIQALFLAAGAFVGGLVGARLSLEIKESGLKILIMIVMIAVAIKFFIDSLGVPF